MRLDDDESRRRESRFGRRENERESHAEEVVEGVGVGGCSRGGELELWEDRRDKK